MRTKVWARKAVPWHDEGMALTPHNPAESFPPYANYAHAIEVPAGARTLHISGLNGYEPNGTTMPDTFEAQAELVWRHLGAVLESARMSYADLVSVRFYLADPSFDPENVAILTRHLGDHTAARTVICARLLEPEWLVEIEAVASKLD
ncbi:MAG: RidA family protein [Solirubrobacterales bacterium]